MLFDVPMHDLAAGDQQLLQGSRNKSGASASAQSHLQCNLRLKQGGRHLLLGKNGCGKTTLLRAVRELAPPKKVTTFLVDQELALLDLDKAVLQSVLSADASWCSMQRRCHELEARVEAQQSERDAEEASRELCSLYEELAKDEGVVREQRARHILAGLGFSPSRMEAPVSSLSGGWKMRAALASALFMNPQLLMLDEPTNHLDMQAIWWLQKYLVEHYNGGSRTLLCVSHDRSFINAVLTEIIVFDRMTLTNFAGTLDEFEAAAQQMSKHLERESATLEQKRAAAALAIKKHQAREVRSMKNKASNIEHNRYGDAQALLYGSAQSSKVTALSRKLNRVGMEKTMDGKRFKMSEHGCRLGSTVDNEGESTGRALMAAPLLQKSDPTLKFHFGDVGHLGVVDGVPILQLQEAGFSYPGQRAPTLAGVNLSVAAGGRIALVGANGAGKTTLINLITGICEPSSGEVRRHRNLRVGHLSQDMTDTLQRMRSTPLAYLLECFPDKTELEMRALLGSFGIKGSLATQELPSLSGGQRARVAFAKVCAERPQLLVLDEPTNHLDIYSIDALTDALKDFPGAVIVATHNHSMLQALCEHAFLVRDGSCEVIPAQCDGSPGSWLMRATPREDTAQDSDSSGSGSGGGARPGPPQDRSARTAAGRRTPAATAARLAGVTDSGSLKLRLRTDSRPAEAEDAPRPQVTVTEPLRATEKEFLRCVKKVRETLRLEQLQASGRLLKTQEEKLQRKGEALRELAEAAAYMPSDSNLRDRNADLLAMLPFGA